MSHARPDPLRIALVSDIHHGPNSFTKRGDRALDLLDRFLAFCAEWGPDVIVDLGDRVSDIDRETDRANLAEVAERFRGLNAPRFHVDGNHDVGFMSAGDNREALGEGGHRSTDINGWHLVFWNADSCIAHPLPFRPNASDLGWLEADLAATDLPTIVFSHVPLGGGAMTGNYWFQNNPEHAAYPNGDEIRRILASSGKVVLAAAGHVHWNSMQVVAGIPYLTVQSLTESFTTGGEAAGAWTTLELEDRRLRLQVHGDDPLTLERTLPPPGGAGWPEPLPRFDTMRRKRKAPRELAGVRALVFDLDGVLYREDEAVPHAREFVQWARARGWPIAALTNNARRTATDYEAKLARLGYDIPADAILTAGAATARTLGFRMPGARAFVAGPPALAEEVERAGLVTDDAHPDVVVAAIDPHMPVARLMHAARLVRGGAKLFVTNPDATHPTPTGLEPESGAVQAFLETAGGATAEVLGKPHPAIFHMALNLLGTPPAETLMVGDTPATDIAGATAAAMLSALVETGNPIDDGADQPQPTVRIANLAALRSALETADA